MITQYQKYQQQSVTSLTAGEQLVLLLEKACVNIAKAINCIEAYDVEGAHNSIVKAENIYYYLMDNLDMNYSVSSNLFSLYDFITGRLVQANIKKDADILKEIQHLAYELRDTWREAEHISRTGTLQ